MSKTFTPVFLGSGRCFHTMDWFRSCCALSEETPKFITDNYGGEGFIPLLEESDEVVELFVIDPLLFRRASFLGHMWRNLLKLAVIPIQILKLRQALRTLHDPFVFAHSTYYAFLASYCNVKYSATPQGSEVLVRPSHSAFYRWFLNRSVRNAEFVTVDSSAMAIKLERLSGVQPDIIQNGIDISKIRNLLDVGCRNRLTSIRGFDRNYRIVELLKARNLNAPDVRLSFCYPFTEEVYFREIKSLTSDNDVLLGRLTRESMYALLKESICIFSVPTSDSSPRSVYEAIFCGAAVICSPASFIQSLPACMRSRIVVVDLSDPSWFSLGLDLAKKISSERFVPSQEALDLFDQLSSMRKCLELASYANDSKEKRSSEVRGTHV